MSHAHVAELVAELVQAVGERLADAAEPGLRGSGAAALLALSGARAGGPIDALAKTVGLTHSGTVRLVDRLARAGLVERRPGADQRSAALYLTPAGRRAARRTLARREGAIESILAPLTQGERQALAELATKLLAHRVST